MNEYEEYNESPFPTETLDAKTLKLLNKVCEGVDVPSDEEMEEALAAHGDEREGV